MKDRMEKLIMKNSIVTMVVATACLAATTLCAQPEIKTSNLSPVGSWIILSSKYGDGAKEDYSRKTPGNRPFMMVTETHVIIGVIDTTTMKLKSIGHGGSVSIRGNALTEFIEFPANLAAAMPTNNLIFRVEQDKLYKSGQIAGSPIEEVWQRLTPKSMQWQRAAYASGGVTLGQQLIDLQKAKESGAITDAEYQAQKAILLEKK